MKYSIVIPTYNHCEDLLKPCVESILKYTTLEDVELIIVANGCRDETSYYLYYLQAWFTVRGMTYNLKRIYAPSPLGYAKAVNLGIEAATADKIVLLNNDTILIDQPKDQWLDLLAAPFANSECGISCVVKSHSPAAGHDFAIFFCAMIARKVFDTIGILNEDYGTGGGEDIEFCIEAERAGFAIKQACSIQAGNDTYTGSFPIYHKGEGTMRDPALVPDWDGIFHTNMMKLARKYNLPWYKEQLMNQYERYMAVNGEHVDPREAARYRWAADNLVGDSVLEVGCSNGYGSQFLPADVVYTGLDYDKNIIDAARAENWGSTKTFVCADVRDYSVAFYDTIIAFEVIEHLDDGIGIVTRLKHQCKRLLVTVPYMEPPGFWGHHHKLHGLNQSHFPGFEFKFINQYGAVLDLPDPNSFNLMMCKWDRK